MTPFFIFSRLSFTSGGSAEVARAWVIKTGHGSFHLDWDLKTFMWSWGAWGRGKWRENVAKGSSEISPQAAQEPLLGTAGRICQVD